MSDSELSELTLQEFVGGTTKVVDVTVKDASGNAVNITGWAFEVTLFAQNVAPIELTDGDGTELVTPASGQWRFTIPADETADLGQVTLSLYIKRVTDTVKYSLGKGTVKVLPAK